MGKYPYLHYMKIKFFLMALLGFIVLTTPVSSVNTDVNDSEISIYMDTNVDYQTIVDICNLTPDYFMKSEAIKKGVIVEVWKVARPPTFIISKVYHYKTKSEKQFYTYCHRPRGGLTKLV